ncbi:unnamed protein product [Linum trigynum]|uniref:CCHC-type domain-containing protein n=1 Tax=Linum trigynum TaxID=586398 RepID=A0AAV2E1J9_9ROSI
MDLDGSFGTVRSQILSIKPTPSLAEAFHMVSTDEQQRLLAQQRSPTSEGASFAARSDTDHPRTPDGRPKCVHCGKVGHFKEMSTVLPTTRDHVGLRTGLIMRAGLKLAHDIGSSSLVQYGTEFCSPS